MKTLNLVITLSGFLLLTVSSHLSAGVEVETPRNADKSAQAAVLVAAIKTQDILKPKFDAVVSIFERELGGKGLATLKDGLLTNNPKKIVGLEGYGLEVVERVPIEIKPTPKNISYLKTKMKKMGHLLTIE